MRRAFRYILASAFLFTIFGCVDESPGGPSSSGQGGSTARFVVQQNHLVTVEDKHIKLYSLQDPLQPNLVNEYVVSTFGLALETVYPYSEDRLLLGTTQGAFILDHSTPGTLQELAFAQHSTRCDPVIARGNYMYVTLRDGRDCSTIQNVNGVNQLLVFDITNVGMMNEFNEVTVPTLVKTIDLNQPWGLGIRDDSLFVCLADTMVEFDISTASNPIEISEHDVACNDVIAATDPMVITGDDGIVLAQKQEGLLVQLATIAKGD